MIAVTALRPAPRYPAMAPTRTVALSAALPGLEHLVDRLLRPVVALHGVGVVVLVGGLRADRPRWPQPAHGVAEYVHVGAAAAGAGGASRKS